jgi:beta-glucosidase
MGVSKPVFHLLLAQAAKLKRTTPRQLSRVTSVRYLVHDVIRGRSEDKTKEIETMLVTRRAAVRLLAASAALPAVGWAIDGAAQAGNVATGSAERGQRGTYKDPSMPLEHRVADLLRRMTMEEKARQLDLYAGVTNWVQPLAEREATFLKENGSHLQPPALSLARPVDSAPKIGKDAVFRAADAERVWGSLGAGSIHGFDPSAEISNAIQTWMIENTRLGIPVLFIEEGLHGYFDGTVFPAPVNLAATWNRELARQTGAAIAAEARANGVAMILAPVLDIARDPRWGRVEEDFGEDPYLGGQLGLAYVKGAQGRSLNTDHTVVAEIKHFVGYGSPESGTNTSPVHAGEREVRTVLLKSMEPAIREGHAMAVMAAYHEMDGLPVVANPHLLIDILRKEWGFQGFVLGDLGAIRHLYDRHFIAATPKDAVCRAINSGVDMQFYDFEHKIFQDAIRSGIADGTLSRVALDRAVSDVLRVKFMLGLFDRSTVPVDLDSKVRRCKAHLDLSLASARQSMTLLKNDNHLLPLSKTLKRIAVVGPNANVAHYGDYADETKGARVSMLDGIKTLLRTAEIIFDAGADIQAMAQKIQHVDVVVVGLGENQKISGEGFDRSNLDLPGNQQALLEAVVATGLPTVLVLQNGRPLTIEWAVKHVPAILEAWYPGEFGGRAIAETLFGENNPSGRLTITFPQSVGQLPDFYNYDPSKKTQYIDSSGAPLFPFGFGLSYTTFRYDSLSVKAPALGSKADVLIAVNVTNTGALAGDEVVQLYFRENVTTVETPIRSLGGFARVSLAAGETKTISLRLSQQQLALWNEYRRWVIEPGSFTVWIGGSSQAALSAPFTLS